MSCQPSHGQWQVDEERLSPHVNVREQCHGIFISWHFSLNQIESAWPFTLWITCYISGIWTPGRGFRRCVAIHWWWCWWWWWSLSGVMFSESWLAMVEKICPDLLLHVDADQRYLLLLLLVFFFPQDNTLHLRKIFLRCRCGVLACMCVCVCGSQTNTSHTERDTRRTQCIHSIPAEQHVSFVFHSSSVPFCYWHRYLKNEKWRKNAFTHTSRRRVTQVLTFNYWLLLKYWLAYFAFVKLHRRLRGMMSPQIVKAKSTVPFSLMTYLQMCK